MTAKNELGAFGEFIAYLVGICLDLVFFKFALGAFIHHATWTQAFWLAFFYAPLSADLTVIKKMLKK